jgi:hypothetical protein
MAIRLYDDAHHTNTMAAFVVQRTIAVVDLAECTRAGSVANAYACATTMAATVAKKNWKEECTEPMVPYLR